MNQTSTRATATKSSMGQTEERLMTRALQLAEQGVGLVSPGPLVGCVIALGDRIVGEGFYEFDKIKHAETVALEQAGDLAHGATAYVSLEPHAHYGRTPPCTDALIAAGIVRVVAPIEDPNPEVSGRGFAHLRSQGISVETGFMASEAEKLNEKYLHFIQTGRPFVHLKLASSLDGKIATRTGDSHWITGERSRARVHELRHQYDAILIGAGTATADDPLLTDRSGKRRRRALVRVLLDKELKLSPASKLATTTDDAPVVVFADVPNDDSRVTELQRMGVEIVRDEAKGRDLAWVLDQLADRSIQSVLIEGGAGVAGNFIDSGLVDKVTVFIAPMIIGGADAPNAIAGGGAERLTDALRLQDVEVIERDRDLEITGYPAREQK